MCYLYGSRGSCYHQLLGEMVCEPLQNLGPTTNFSSSFSNYGGIPIKSEYSHEAVGINQLYHC